MRFIDEMDVNNKKVILRCDLNIPIDKGIILSEEKIKASLETINYLLERNAKVIIMSHLGRIKSEEDKETKSLEKVFNRLKEILNTDNIYFSKHTRGEELKKEIDNLQEGDILVIENTRFEDLDGKKESSNDEELAKEWASLGEVFINDAFGLTHRNHASNSGIAKHLPSGYGFLIKKELEGLDAVMNPERPFVVVMSGAKVADKIDLMAQILEKCDYLLLGGGIAHTFNATEHDMGNSLVSYDSLDEVKKLLDQYPDKIVMPVDGINHDETIKVIGSLSEGDDLCDIGPDTIEKYQEYLNKAKTIFINGASGIYEDDRFAGGTKAVLEMSTTSGAKVILGGGDAVASAEKFSIEGFHFVSTGGGATLNYIGSGKLKCEE